MNSATILILFTIVLHHTTASTDQNPNIWQIVNEDERLQTFALALKAAGIDEAGQQGGSATVFAPSNEAFAKVPQEIVEHLSDPQNKEELALLLAYHAIGDKALTSADLLKLDLPARLQTLSGDFLTVSKQGNQVKVNDATVVAADILASNGVIHIIDAVLAPKLARK